MNGDIYNVCKKSQKRIVERIERDYKITMRESCD